MNQAQWTILGIFLVVMQSFFIYQDRFWGTICRSFGSSAPATKNMIVACINAEIYEPFIWFLLPLALIFFVCGFLETKKKKHQ